MKIQQAEYSWILGLKALLEPIRDVAILWIRAKILKDKTAQTILNFLTVHAIVNLLVSFP